jgi:hypothetical protein
MSGWRDRRVGPRPLFDQRYAFGVGITTPNYDVSADGERLLMVKDESGSARLNVWCSIGSMS